MGLNLDEKAGIKGRLLGLFQGPNPRDIELLNGRPPFQANCTSDGITVSNLVAPFLKWEAFYAAVEIVWAQTGGARNGNGRNARLGEPGLELTSIEGNVAKEVYGYQVGEHVLARNAPITGLLRKAGILESFKGGHRRVQGVKLDA
jgi:hypothetical protein